MTGAPDHPDLLAMARLVRGAVERDDTDGLHAELTRLRAAVMDHVRAERAQLDALPGSGAAIAIDGQRRLLRLLTDALSTPAGGHGGDDGNCLVRAARIEASLRRQARLEATLLRRHPVRPDDGHPTAGRSPGGCGTPAVRRQPPAVGLRKGPSALTRPAPVSLPLVER